MPAVRVDPSGPAVAPGLGRRLRPASRRTNAALTALVFAASGGQPAAAPEPRLRSIAPRLRRELRARAAAARRAGGDPTAHGAVTLAAMLQARHLSSVELTEAYLARIARLNGDGGAIAVGRGPEGPDPSHAVYAGNGALNAFVTVYAETARRAARAADIRLDAAARSGVPAPLLCGLPVALKDVIAVDGLPLSLGCPSLRGQRVAGDSAIWARLEADGAVLLGHTHTGPWTADDLCPQTANPWDPALAIGGSSGGSAAAAAARLAALTVGTDTGNSVRNPAQQAGISALKPSHGLIPLTGVAPLIPGLDHAGPMAAALEDVSLMLSTLAGFEPTDPRTRRATGWAVPARFPLLAHGGSRPLLGVRIGSTIETEPEPSRDRWDPEILAALRRCEDELRALGAEIVPITPPGRVHAETHDRLVDHHRREVLAATYAQTEDAAVEAAVRLRHRHAPDERDALVDGPAPDPAAIAEAELHRRAYRTDWGRTMSRNRLDAVLWPQKVQRPPRRDDDFTERFEGVDQARANTLGWPCAHMPVGPGAAGGLPVGVDLAAPWGRDAALLRIALEYQAAYPHHEARAPAMR